MPLKCLDNVGNTVLSFALSPEQWAGLKQANKAAAHLSMPCCGSGVVLKMSRLGTQFFAHARRGICGGAPETAEHLKAKETIAQVAADAGWRVETEAREIAPNGQEWVADVLAVLGNKRIVFEVQWSRQDIESTRTRQAKYKLSGVEAVWLMRQMDLPPARQDTPALNLTLDETGNFLVRIRAAGHRGASNNLDGSWYKTLPLEQFVRGVLDGRFRWKVAQGSKVPIAVHGVQIECWRCKRTTTAVMDFVAHIDDVFPDHPRASFGYGDLAEHQELISMLVPEGQRKQHEIGQLKMRYSRTADEDYLSNGCFHCDTLLGRFFDHGYWHESARLYEVATRVEGGLLDLLSERGGIECWWFDGGPENA